MGVAAIKEPTRVLLAGLLMLPAALVAVAIGPRIGKYEGKAFKVIRDFRVISREATPDGYIKIVATYQKARACRALDGFNEIEIDVGGGFYTPFFFNTEKRVESKPVGNWPVTLIVNAPAAYKDQNLRITAHHDCWGGWLWVTETPVIDQSK